MRPRRAKIDQRVRGAFLGCSFVAAPAHSLMLGRISQPRPSDLPARPDRSLASCVLARLRAQAIAYYVRTGHWPKLAPHDMDSPGVWG